MKEWKKETLRHHIVNAIVFRNLVIKIFSQNLCLKNVFIEN